jgi:superfamily II DNA helicase RecQ
MQPKSVLAITATAGPRVIEDIGETLGIGQANIESAATNQSEKLACMENDCIKIIRSGRDNIDVMCKFMANHEERLAVLVRILSSQITKDDQDEKYPYAGTLLQGSVIVYVWRQKDTEVVTEYLLASGVSGGVVMYHGGMDANARAKAQNKFMRGKARVCVATVAFGLGIDKADVVGVSEDIDLTNVYDSISYAFSPSHLRSLILLKGRSPELV